MPPVSNGPGICLAHASPHASADAWGRSLRLGMPPLATSAARNLGMAPLATSASLRSLPPLGSARYLGMPPLATSLGLRSLPPFGSACLRVRMPPSLPCLFPHPLASLPERKRGSGSKTGGAMRREGGREEEREGGREGGREGASERVHGSERDC